LSLLTDFVVNNLKQQPLCTDVDRYEHILRVGGQDVVESEEHHC